MLFNRQWAMANKNTFLIKPIETLIKKYLTQDMYSIDPFCGNHSPATFKNDMNLKIKANCHIDALMFLKFQEDKKFDLGFYDPPYSFRQVKESYNNIGIEKFDPRQTRSDYWADVRSELARIIKINGLVICCGWNSGGLGINRGFDLLEVLLVPHGGGRNDTIVTVEKKNR